MLTQSARVNPPLFQPISEKVMRLKTLCLLLAISLAPTVASAQSQCEEPTDDEYVGRMAEMREAIESNDFVRVRNIANWALTEHDYAPLHYSRARALHRLEDWAEAEAAYNDFLRAFEVCADPTGLREAAREYRLQTIRYRQAEAESFNLAWIPIILGSGLVVSGVVFDITSMDLLDEKEEAAARGDRDAYDDYSEDIDQARIVDYLLYGAGAAALIVGTTLFLIGGDDDMEPTQIGWTPLTGGGAVTFSGMF